MAAGPPRVSFSVLGEDTGSVETSTLGERVDVDEALVPVVDDAGFLFEVT